MFENYRSFIRIPAFSFCIVCVIAVLGCGRTKSSPGKVALNQEREAANLEWASLDGATLRKYFFDNAPPAWERYRNSLSQVRVDYEIGEPILDTGKYFVNGKCQMFHMPGDRIVCQNGDYQFSVVKNHGEQWQLESFRRLDSKVDEHTSHSSVVLESAPQIVDRLLKVHGASLPELVESGVFTIEDANVVQIDGKPFVRIDFSGEFERHGFDWNLGSDPIVLSHVILDPENYWIIKSAAVYDDTKTGIVSTYSADLNAPVPVPLTYNSVWDYESSGAGWKEGPEEKRYKFHFEPTSNFEFQLSAYGIDEPKEEIRKGTGIEGR